jgi:hypothetical protein
VVSFGPHLRLVFRHPALEIAAHFRIPSVRSLRSHSSNPSSQIGIDLARLRDAQLRVRRGTRVLVVGEQLLEELLAGLKPV